MALTNRFYGVFDLYLGLNSSFIIITQLFNMYYTHFTLTLLILLMSIKLDTICKYYEKNMVACRQIWKTNLKIPSGSRGLSESFLKIQCVNTRHLPV